MRCRRFVSYGFIVGGWMGTNIEIMGKRIVISYLARSCLITVLIVYDDKKPHFV